MKANIGRWAAVSSIAAKISRTVQSLKEWMEKAEVDSGVPTGLPSEVAEKLKALERGNRELRQANEILRRRRAYLAQAEFHRPVQAMIAFIDDRRHRRLYPSHRRSAGEQNRICPASFSIPGTGVS